MEGDRDVQPVVTISAAYGAGGGLIGRRVAERLGVGFVDRAISAAVAADLCERTERVESFEDELGSGAGHWLAAFADAAGAWGGLLAPGQHWFHDTEAYRLHIDAVAHREAASGAVVLGRGGQIVLCDVDNALHVRLDGPVDRRVARAVELGGVAPDQARRSQQQTDSNRRRYLQRLYRRDVSDPRLYHLVIDSTAVPWVTCVELIVAAVAGCDRLRRLDQLIDEQTA